MVELSVVIPAYNESRRIERTLERIREYLKAGGKNFEVIVADDGSSDDTVALVQKMVEKFPELILLKLSHQGKGGAVRVGALSAKGKFILMSDADLSTPIEEVQKLKAALEKGNDLAIGSRRASGAAIKKHQPWLRQTVGLMFGFFTRRIVNTGVLDSQCGFKLFPAGVAKKLFTLQTSNGFCFDIELLGLARKMGLKIAEVPVVWEDAEGSKVSPLKHLPAVVLEILQIRINLWKRGKLGG
jgi:dolichyl-phosphate beta-glucosyltransferase